MVSRRWFIAGTAGLAGSIAAFPLAHLSALPAGASEWEKPGDMAIGRPDAPITVIEYFSLTCPHCRNFHTDVYPIIKKKYVDNGTVRLIFRDFPLNRPAMDAALLARCAGSHNYFAFIDTLFDTFDNWTRSSDYLNALIQIGQIGGIKESDFLACKNNEEMETKILSGMIEADETYTIQSTPTFIINVKKYDQGMSFNKFQNIVEEILPDV